MAANQLVNDHPRAIPGHADPVAPSKLYGVVQTTSKHPALIFGSHCVYHEPEAQRRGSTFNPVGVDCIYVCPWPERYGHRVLPLFRATTPGSTHEVTPPIVVTTVAQSKITFPYQGEDLPENSPVFELPSSKQEREAEDKIETTDRDLAAEIDQENMDYFGISRVAAETQELQRAFQDEVRLDNPDDVANPSSPPPEPHMVPVVSDSPDDPASDDTEGEGAIPAIGDVDALSEFTTSSVGLSSSSSEDNEDIEPKRPRQKPDQVLWLQLS